MYRDTNFEVKRKVSLGYGMKSAKLIKLLSRGMHKILNSLWNDQAELFTRSIVRESLMIQQVPREIQYKLSERLEQFKKNQFSGFITNAMQMSAMGANRQSRKDGIPVKDDIPVMATPAIPGLMTEINNLTGLNIIFNTNTAEAARYIEEAGANLVVEMEAQQIRSLKYILDMSYKEQWGINRTTMTMRQGLALNMKRNVAVQNAYKSSYEYWLKEFNLLSDMSPAQAEAAARRNAFRHMQKRLAFHKDSRSRSITVTELTRANGQAKVESVRQAWGTGKIKKAMKTWRRQNLRDNWPSSEMNDGRSIPAFEGFYVPAGSTMTTNQGPSEINEYCDLEFDMWV